MINVNDVKVLTAKGDSKSLSDYFGKVLLIVNVASRCGFTPQYEKLQKLQNKYKDQGFVILGFPCNDFGSQEPGSIEEIQSFCKVQYGVDFEIFEKVHAKGKTTEPYTTLNQTNPSGEVEWNFEKFIVGKNGDVISRFKSQITPDDPKLIETIEKELEA